VGRQLGLGGPVPRCAPHCLHGDVHLWCASAHLVYWYIVQPTVQTLGICPVPLGVVCVLLDILFWILVLSRYSPTLKMSIWLRIVERLEAAMQSLLLRGGKSLAPFEVTYALSILPTNGPYAFWPERLWFTDRRIVVKLLLIWTLCA